MVQRFKVALIREIWLSVRETERFFLYPEDSWIIRESWHVFTKCQGFQSRYCFPLIVSHLSIYGCFSSSLSSHISFCSHMFHSITYFVQVIRLKLALEFVFLFFEPSWDSYACVTRFFDVV